MGNVCSSGQKKKKDSLSEKSDDSPAYQPNVKKDTKTSDEILISSSDSVPIAQNTTDSCKVSGLKPNVEKVSQGIEKKCANDSTSSTPQTIVAPSEVSSKHTIPSHLSILHGKLSKFKKVERDKKIVIYILTDNSKENKSLKNVIHCLYNQFEKKCQIRGFEFIISDVHECQDVKNREHPKSLDINQWAQSPLEAKGGHEEAANCLAEISRHISNAYIIPVLLLGSSLETPMLPLTIESQDFKSVLNLASEEDRVLLEMWYKTDDSYQPACHRLHTNLTNNISEDSTVALQNLLNALLRLFSEDLKDSYMTTVVEQEINNTVLISQELAKRCIWIHSGTQYLKTPDAASPLETEVFRRLTKIYAELKAHLSEKNVIRILPSMNILDEDLASVIESLLDRSIAAIFDEHTNKNSIPYNTNGIVKKLIEEVQLVSHYSSILAQNSSNFFVMDDIKRYVENNSEFPLIVTGSSGIGKSVLVSKIVENIFNWNSEINLIVRYFNLSDESSDITSLLGSIANQLSVIVNGSQCRTEHSNSEYTKVIKNLLESSNINVVIIIDSINEALNGNNFDWLPINLKITTKIILTLTEIEESETSAMKELLTRGIPTTNFIKLKHFTNKQWSDILFPGYGDIYVPNRALRLPEEWTALNGQTPFHAKALWWLAWLGHTSIESSNILDILEKMFAALESKFMSKDIELLLLIISLCNWGIRESDCLAIFHGESQAEAQATFRIWSKFCWIMGPMLLYLNNIRIADKIFRDAILNRFKSKKMLVHKMISEYFQKQPSTFTSSNGLTVTSNHQKFLKLPYHYLCALDETSNEKNSQTFYNSHFFTDLEWIFNKVVSTGSSSLLYDIIFAENYFKSDCKSFPHIFILSQFLRSYVYELNYDGRQFLTLLKSFLKTKISDENCTSNQKIITDWLSDIDNYKSTFLEILNSIAKDPEVKSSFRGYDALVYLPDNGFFVASLSTEKEEICIWDVKKCERVRKLRGIPQPTAMVPVGIFEAAVLCKREIRVINLDEGKFKVKLKGVMNQKMPYFGLHDEKHLVCLSRNRMYVNLMNLESGDCVTTFKAGEDRFLNSLLVSGDGRILVCGDETQKPFPLLVWHLSQRKLLYDLRIPHHDFLTSLSAITYEGSYVCVVAKELNESTPNFIVVYDLQSGTLFKKWKPTYNTVSLAISQINACVIAGLEDAKILIWDLITGNCRSTLVGHNAPVTLLKLDPLGKVLLSRDEEGRDYSIRLWELSSGTPLAVYTPPCQISTCEILPNGSFVVLALKNHATILTLALKNYCEVPNETTNLYGNEENQHKIFDLN